MDRGYYRIEEKLARLGANMSAFIDMLPFAVKKLVFYAYKKGMTKMFGCIFCQVAAHKKPAKILHEDEQCVVFRDIDAKAPVHFLVIPRKHIRL